MVQRKQIPPPNGGRGLGKMKLFGEGVKFS
jgi:hypothetical protein